MLFVKRLAEECAYTFAGTFAAVAATGDLGTAGLVAAAVAGGRAVFGLIAKRVGDRDKPTLVK